MSGWRDEWENKGYRARLEGSETDFIRVRMHVGRGRLLRFTAQYEAIMDNRVYPAIRYDTAHGAAHRDTLDWYGHVVAKKQLPDQPLDQSLAEAVADIKAQWPTYRRQFERRRP